MATLVSFLFSCLLFKITVELTNNHVIQSTSPTDGPNASHFFLITQFSTVKAKIDLHHKTKSLQFVFFFTF